jgi:uncharacterized protein (DUF488 family)
MAALELITFGHGAAGREELCRLLRGAGVAAVVDVRTAPGSRHNPDTNQERIQRWLPEAGVPCLWEPRLGGFRKPLPDSPDVV